jgi:putative peptidoglycan lipid II flippase
MLVLSVPATVGLMVLTRPIVELIYQRGRFDSESAALVAAGLFYYAPGVVGYSIVKIASPSFYSLRDARTPVITSVTTIAVNLALNLWLHRVMGFQGLALGTSIAANVNAVLLLWLLSRRLGGIDGGRVLRLFVKIAVASAIMGAAAYDREAWLHGALPARTILARLVRVAGGIGAGLGTLALAAWALRIEEFRTAMRRVLRRA